MSGTFTSYPTSAPFTPHYLVGRVRTDSPLSFASGASSTVTSPEISTFHTPQISPQPRVTLTPTPQTLPFIYQHEIIDDPLTAHLKMTMHEEDQHTYHMYPYQGPNKRKRSFLHTITPSNHKIQRIDDTIDDIDTYRYDIHIPSYDTLNRGSSGMSTTFNMTLNMTSPAITSTSTSHMTVPDLPASDIPTPLPYPSPPAPHTFIPIPSQPSSTISSQTPCHHSLSTSSSLNIPTITPVRPTPARINYPISTHVISSKKSPKKSPKTTKIKSKSTSKRTRTAKKRRKETKEEEEEGEVQEQAAPSPQRPPTSPTKLVPPSPSKVPPQSPAKIISPSQECIPPSSSSPSPEALALAEKNSYPLASWNDIFTRVHYILRRDHMKQKEMVNDIGFSGSTLSPMLKGKYKHTKEQHVSRLRQWCYTRDLTLWKRVATHAASLQMNESMVASTLQISHDLFLKWLAFTIEVNERQVIDEMILTWLGDRSDSFTPEEDIEENEDVEDVVEDPIPIRITRGRAKKENDESTSTNDESKPIVKEKCIVKLHEKLCHKSPSKPISESSTITDPVKCINQVHTAKSMALDKLKKSEIPKSPKSPTKQRSPRKTISKRMPTTPKHTNPPKCTYTTSPTRKPVTIPSTRPVVTIPRRPVTSQRLFTSTSPRPSSYPALLHGSNHDHRPSSAHPYVPNIYHSYPTSSSPSYPSIPDTSIPFSLLANLSTLTPSQQQEQIEQIESQQASLLANVQRCELMKHIIKNLPMNHKIHNV